MAEKSLPIPAPKRSPGSFTAVYKTKSGTLRAVECRFFARKVRGAQPEAVESEPSSTSLAFLHFFDDFHKAGDHTVVIFPKQGSFVPVAAFSVEPSDVKALDDYENVENNLYRIEAVSTEVTGHGMLSGFWYIMNDGQPRLPSDRYWNTVLEGYQDVGFDRALLDEARRECQQND